MPIRLIAQALSKDAAMKYRILLTFALFALFAPLAQAAEMPLPSVSVATIEKKPASKALRYLGRIEAIHAVDVHTRTDGFIQKVNFAEGQMVKEGDILFEINPAVHQAERDQAAAAVRNAEAALSLAEINLTRLDGLLRRNAVSRAEVDTAQANRDMADAALGQAKATLQTRELFLGFTKIFAPISGRIGHTRFDTGSYISPASGSLVDVVQLDPIRVVISIRERDFISATLQDKQLHLDLLGKDFAPQLRLANGKIYPYRGEFDSLSNRIDVQTGSVEVRARFTNPQQVLLPGGVTDVSLDAQNPPLLPVVPISALQQNRDGHFVLVVDKDNTVAVRPVVLGMQLDQTFVVTEGLAEGEQVIVEGLQRVRPGMKVNPLAAMPLGQ